MNTQNAQILQHMQAGNRITPLEALDKYGCFRLGARVYDLRVQGHDVKQRMVKTGNGKRVAEYWI